MSKIVVFDVDGTLCDTRRGIIKTINFVYKSMDLPKISSQMENYYIGPPVKESFMKYGKLSEEEAAEATELYRKKYVEHYIDYSTVYDGIIPVLKYLKNKGDVLCIASMKTMPQLNRLLGYLQLERYFEVVKGASEDGSITKKDMLLEIRSQFDLQREFYMIGDTNGDYLAANAEGYKFIGANYGYGKLAPGSNSEYINYPIEITQLL